MKKQQKQTKNYFEKFASEWQARSSKKKIELYNTVQQRNNYVLNYIKKNKPKKFLDIGCGSGELAITSSSYTKQSLGIDFSKSMIDLCNKKIRKKNNVKFICDSFFNINFKKNSFDLISANGFIEYISLDQLDMFLNICRKLLRSNGRLILSSRNRLFNLFSLNNFSRNEILNNTSLKFLFEESINLAQQDFKSFIKLKRKLPFTKLIKQEKTSINVNVRYQFTPLQLIDLLKKFKFQTLDLYPINYHPIIPSNFSSKNKEIRKISNNLLKNFPKINMIPNSSAFMIAAKCK